MECESRRVNKKMFAKKKVEKFLTKINSRIINFYSSLTVFDNWLVSHSHRTVRAWCWVASLKMRYWMRCIAQKNSEHEFIFKLVSDWNMLRFIKIVFSSLHLLSPTSAPRPVGEEIIIDNKFFTPFRAIFTPFSSHRLLLVHAPEMIVEENHLWPLQNSIPVTSSARGSESWDGYLQEIL